jgi:DNA repair protein RecO (recombination protein O)
MTQMLRALVLRRRDAGESDRALTLLTEERGLVEVVAKGARKVGSRLAGCSEPLAVCELEVAKGKAREFVTQAQPILSFPGLRSDFDRLSCGLALAEILAATTPHERPEPELFAFSLVSLQTVERHEKPLVALAWAEVGLLELTGNLPSFDRCVETGSSIGEAKPWFSPSAGGYLSPEAAANVQDRFRTVPEALIGLARLADVEEAPGNLKFAEECLRCLHRVWTEIAGRRLRAMEQVLEGLRLTGNSG